MKKLGLLTAVVALGIMAFSMPAKAAPVLGSGTNGIWFENVENWVDVDADSKISTGDLFYGILNVQNIKNGGTDVWGMDNIAAGGLDTLSGYFLTEVTSVDVHGGLGAIDAHIEFGAAAADPNGIMNAGDLGTGTMLKLFSDDTSMGGPGTAYTTNSGLGSAGDIANATDGSVWASLGFGTDGYWYSHAPALPPTNVGETVGDSWFGLDFLINNTGKTFLPVDDPLESESGVGGISLVEMYATSNINVNDTRITGGYNWGFTSQDPAVVVTPEPSTFILLGGGLLGAALLRRKAKKNKA